MNSCHSSSTIRWDYSLRWIRWSCASSKQSALSMMLQIIPVKISMIEEIPSRNSSSWRDPRSSSLIVHSSLAEWEESTATMCWIHPITSTPRRLSVAFRDSTGWIARRECARPSASLKLHAMKPRSNHSELSHLWAPITHQTSSNVDRPNKKRCCDSR